VDSLGHFKLFVLDNVNWRDVFPVVVVVIVVQLVDE